MTATKRTSPPPTTPSELLVDVLAQVDSLFCGPREYYRGHPLPTRATAEIFERRVRYLTGAGVALQIGGDAATRKAGERLFDQLADVGAVAIATQAGRRSGVTLTDSGDVVARRLTAAPDAAASWSLLSSLATMAESDALLYGGQSWVRETTAAELLDQDKPLAYRLAELEFALLPLKCRGLVIDNTDCAGRLCYSLTAAGRATARLPAPSLPEHLPSMDDALADRYSTALPRLANERSGWKPEVPGRLHIPLPVAFAGGRPDACTA